MANVPKQPRDIEEIMQGFSEIRKQLLDISPRIASSPFNGKTKHPGFGYLNAAEWVQVIDMHFRHHLRQKRRLEEFLNAI